MMSRMHRCGRQIVCILSVLLAVASIGKTVDAYVLQGPHILELMIEKLGRARRLLVSQTLQSHGSGSHSVPVELRETLRFSFPEMFRADIQTENTRRIHVLSKGEVLTIVDGQVEIDTETRFDLYKDILLFRSRPLLEHRLTRFGVDVSVSSLGRLKDKPVFIVGAHYPDESVPQIWIDKRTFLPLRWIVTRTAGGNRKDSLEVRYSQWKKDSGTYYPNRIEFLQGDDLMRRIEVNDVRVNPAFPDALFDIEHLKSINQPATPITSGQIEIKELSEVQKTIEDFKKIFE